MSGIHGLLTTAAAVNAVAAHLVIARMAFSDVEVSEGDQNQQKAMFASISDQLSASFRDSGEAFERDLRECLRSAIEDIYEDLPEHIQAMCEAAGI